MPASRRLQGLARVCAEPGCPELVQRGHRCPEHRLRPEGSTRAWRKLVAQVVRRDHGVCWLCGEAGATSADHLVRVREGGDDSLENLRAAHVDCNRRRG